MTGRHSLQSSMTIAARAATLLVALLAASACATPSAAPPTARAQMCTAPAPDTQSTARAAKSRLRVSISDRFGPYPGTSTIMVSDMSGMPLISIVCNAPLAEFALDPGRYRVMAFIGDEQSNESIVDVPRSGVAELALGLRLPPEKPPGTPIVSVPTPAGPSAA